jgi:hypothetical protein
MGEEAQQARWSKAYAHVISQKRLGCAVDHTAPSTLVGAKPIIASQQQFKLTTIHQIFTMALLSPSGKKYFRKPISDLMHYYCTSPQEPIPSSHSPASALFSIPRASHLGRDSTKRVKNKLFLHIDLSKIDCRSNDNVWICHSSFTVTFPRDRIHSFCHVQKL